VLDLANAHIKTLYCQSNLNQFEILNIGNGKGITVFELIKSFQSITGVTINYKLSPRRDGDLPVFWANSSEAIEKLTWQPEFDIDQMCLDTWNWQKNNPNGYTEKN
jgi:UDP-glucose 4-epimerase